MRGGYKGRAGRNYAKDHLRFYARKRASDVTEAKELKFRGMECLEGTKAAAG